MAGIAEHIMACNNNCVGVCVYIQYTPDKWMLKRQSNKNLYLHCTLGEALHAALLPNKSTAP